MQGISFATGNGIFTFLLIYEATDEYLRLHHEFPELLQCAAPDVRLRILPQDETHNLVGWSESHC